MKIDSFDISSVSSHEYQKIEHNVTRLATIKNSGLFAQPVKQKTDAPAEEQLVEAELKNAAENNENLGAANEDDKNLAEEMRQAAKKFIASQASAIPKGITDFASSIEDTKIKLLEQMIYALTGKRVNFKLERPDPTQRNESTNLRNLIKLGTAQSSGDSRDHLIVNEEKEEFYFESETMSYNAKGQIKTADGQTISVDVNVNMTRAFSSYSFASKEVLRQAIDPLVINFGGKAAALNGESFDFDLDIDGNIEKLNFLGEGSGFLALDKNGDGIINDGSELFGPSTGSGFSELSSFDEDGNGWIDENDEIFNRLRVWSKDKEGNDLLFTLKEADVGAIYLGAEATDFSIKDASNTPQGIIRSTSFYLKENGEAGTVNHLDLTL